MGSKFSGNVCNECRNSHAKFYAIDAAESTESSVTISPPFLRYLEKNIRWGGGGRYPPVGARAKSLKEIGQKLWVGRVQIYKTETWTWQCASFRDLVT